MNIEKPIRSARDMVAQYERMAAHKAKKFSLPRQTAINTQTAGASPRPYEIAKPLAKSKSLPFSTVSTHFSTDSKTHPFHVYNTVVNPLSTPKNFIFHHSVFAVYIFLYTMGKTKRKGNIHSINR